jgi:hypothetical protein
LGGSGTVERKGRTPPLGTTGANARKETLSVYEQKKIHRRGRTENHKKSKSQGQKAKRKRMFLTEIAQCTEKKLHNIT